MKLKSKEKVATQATACLIWKIVKKHNPKCSISHKVHFYTSDSFSYKLLQLKLFVTFSIISSSTDVVHPGFSTPLHRVAITELGRAGNVVKISRVYVTLSQTYYW